MGKKSHEKNFPKGAEWRKWDLHIHSDASDGKMTCDQIINAAIDQDLSVIALTDHHTAKNVDLIRKLGKEAGLAIIAGIEFRTEYGSRSVHLVGHFPEIFNDYELNSKNLLAFILDHLDLAEAKIIAQGRKWCLENGKETVSDEEAFKQGMFCVQVDFKKAAKLIHDFGGIVIPHAGSKDHSLEKEMKHEGKPGVSLYESLGPVKQALFDDGYIDICEIASQSDSASFYLDKFNRASIISSDAHMISEIGRKFTWIKADPTFEGLKQVIREPESRVFIGDRPPLIQRMELNPTKYFKSITIKPEDGYQGDIGKWFDSVRIDFNPELIAIIGNKGSGKSAIADILGLCTNSRRKAQFSFLKPDRFCKKGYANNFYAELNWLSEESPTLKNLMDKVDATLPERAKYLPQGYFEELCNEIDSLDQFKKEINEVVFQHVPDELKLDKPTFESFLDHKGNAIDVAIAKSQERLKSQNRKIISLEKMRNPLYIQELRNNIEQKGQELISLKRPKTVKDPSKEKSFKQQKASLGNEINKINSAMTKLAQEIENTKKDRGHLNNEINELSQFKREISYYEKELNQFIRQKRKIFEHISEIDIDKIINISFDTSIIDKLILARKASMKLLSEKLSETSILDDEGIERSFIIKKTTLEDELNKLLRQLDRPNHAYQNYLTEKTKWKSEKANIEGSKNIPGTLTYLKHQIEYVKSNLQTDLHNERSEREKIIREIYANKKEIIDIYGEIKEFITRTLNEHIAKIEDYPIQVVGELIISPAFRKHLLSFINKTVSGNFRGIEEGDIFLAGILNGKDINDEAKLNEFLQEMIHSLEEEIYDDKIIPRYIDDQVEDMEGFYNYLFGLDFLDENYQLKLGDKSLETLSPGEKGALLLVFYLLLDKSDIPLILDQPEDNLDNQSVFEILVPFIKDAKKRRQIVMITHNPNLAVVADAEQIIRVDILKDQGHEFIFASGSIENAIIKKAIVDVLEGTMPAFMNRSDKYE